MTGFHDIPVELIEHVLEYLPSQSQAMLLRTSRSLSHPSFWPILYHSVILQDNEQVDQFLRTIRTPSTTHGQHVRQVVISTRLNQPRSYILTTLQQACPNVTAVRLTPEQHQYNSFNYRCDIKLWPHLISASEQLYSNIHEIIQSTHQQLIYLSVNTLPTPPVSMPFLTTLKYYADILDFETLNQLNQYCPSLRTLSLNGLDVCRPMTAAWTANQSLKNLEIDQVYFADPGWYNTFSKLYPQLRSLVLQHLASSSKTSLTAIQIYNMMMGDYDDDVDVVVSELSLQERQEQRQHRASSFRRYYTWDDTVRAMDELMMGLTKLRRLHIYSIGALPLTTDDTDCLTFFDRLDALDDVRLDWYCKPLKTPVGTTEKEAAPKWARVHRLIQACPHVRSWHLFLRHDPIPLQRQALELLATRRLVSLTLHTTHESDTTLPIDALLTQLPSLTTLELWTKFGNDLRSPIEQQAPRLKHLVLPLDPHGLTRFVYIGKLASSRLIAYVHARCPRLSVLHLDARQTKKPITLNLAGTHLKELDLGSSLTVGKMKRSVVVKEANKSRWYAFANGAWERVPWAPEPHLTIMCDAVDSCVYKPS
ncbi:hypothetical protein [Absidia glauca]|uniref:F-box domain-containing protein n=1 Tax=Absidia glauca TaxID=4829 RepID=A0A163KVS0_ABSGL|nr:hypothetical protein [Absidia glauca]